MGDHYDHIGVYVDDPEIASKDPGSHPQHTYGKYEFKLIWNPTYHLGCEFYRDDEGVLKPKCQEIH
jgi:hypothetical protein